MIKFYKSLKFLTCIFLFSFGVGSAFGQLSITGTTKQTVDFNSFDGSGFATAPSAAQLDADNWALTGFSDGDLDFGIDGTTGDYARGQVLIADSRPTGGGIYSFEVQPTDFALGFQGTGSDFTPGTITLRIQNNAGITVSDIDIEYLIYAFNDQDRSNSFNLSYSLDNTSYTDVSALDFVTTEVADGSPTWTSTPKSTTISGLALNDGEFFYIRWSSDDVSGGGSRDEIAIDEIGITFTEASAAVEPDEHASSISTSDVLSTSAQLNWTDATGSNLPNAYLVQIVESGLTFDDVTDGNFISNDIDFSDGKASINVNYGLESVAVTGLTAETTYDVQIYSYGTGIGGPNYKTDGTVPSLSFTTQDVLIIADFATDLLAGNWSEFTVSGSESWTYEALDNWISMNAFPGGCSGEAWLFSPIINFDGSTSETLIFSVEENFSGTDLEIYSSSDYALGQDPSGFTFNLLTTINSGNEGTYTLDLSSITGQNVIAFKYEDDASCGEWRLTSFDISADLCDAPSTQASNVSFGSTDDNSMVINWTQGNGDKALVVMKEGTSVNSDPLSGVTYTANTIFASGDEIGSGNYVVFAGNSSDQMVNVTGLNQATTYHVAVYEFNDVDKCYSIDNPATGNNTTATPNDEDSDITAPTSQVAAGNISSLANDAGSAVDVFAFEVTDAGTTDGVPTNINQVIIEKATGNTVVDWSAVIAGASLNDGTSDIAVTNVIVNANDITFDLTGNEYVVADGDNIEFTLSVYLSSEVADGELLQFEIPTDHMFIADAIGSVFQTTLSSAVTSNLQTIDVEATTFNIEVPANTAPNSDFIVAVDAVDANGNIDMDARSISLELETGTGNLSSVTGLSSQAMVNGEFTWSDVQYDTEEEIILQVTDGVITSSSSTINIFTALGDLFFSEYIEGSSNNKAIEIFNNLGAEADLTLYRIIRDNNGTTGSADTLELADINATLANNGILVIANPGATQEILDVADITSEITFYNGDDALRLVKDGVVIDQIGEVGSDPGTAWDVAGGPSVTGGGATAEFTLVRKSNIMTGNPAPLASFGTDPSNSEWIVFAQNEFSNLGFHTIDGVDQPTIGITQSISDFGPIDNGASSASQSFTVEGENLSDNIIIEATDGFEVSLDDSSFGSLVSIDGSTGTVMSTDVFVRFSPTTGINGLVEGTKTVSTAGTANQSFSVTGTEAGNASAVVETFDECLELNSWSQFSVVGDDQTWECTGFGRNNSDGVQMSGFSGGALDNEDWLISPELGLTANSTLTFWSRTEFSGLPIEVKVSEDYSGEGDPSTATWTNLTVTLPAPESNTWTETSGVDLSAFAGESKYIAFVYYSNPTDGSTRWTLDDIVVFDATTGPMPSITITQSLTDFGTVETGNVSASQSFTIDGENLTDDIAIEASAGFEVSLDNSTFDASVVVDGSTGTVTAAEIFVRFAPTTGTNATIDGIITISTAGAQNQSFSVNGTEVLGIQIDDTDFSGDFGQVQIGTTSGVSSYELTASGLTEDVTVSVSGEFEVSLTEDFSGVVGNASTPLSVEQLQGDIESTLVYVRFAPTIEGTTTGTITNSSAGVADVTVGVSGEGTAEEVTGIEDLLVKEIKLFPNPVTNGNLNIELSSQLGEVEVKLMTLTGTIVRSLITTGSAELKIGEAKSGIYVIQLTNENFTENYRVIIP